MSWRSSGPFARRTGLQRDLIEESVNWGERHLGFIAKLLGQPSRGRVLVKLYGEDEASITSSVNLTMQEWVPVYLVHLAKTLYTISDDDVARMLLSEAGSVAENLTGDSDQPRSPLDAKEFLLMRMDVELVAEKEGGGKVFTIDIVGKEGDVPTIQTGLPPRCALGEIAFSNLALLYHIVERLDSPDEAFALGLFIKSMIKYYERGGSHHQVSSIAKAPQYALAMVQEMRGKIAGKSSEA